MTRREKSEDKRSKIKPSTDDNRQQKPNRCHVIISPRSPVHMSIFSVHSKEANKPARFFTIPDLNLDLAGGSLGPCNQHDWTRTPPAWPAARLFPEESKNIGQENRNSVLEYALDWGRRLGRLGMAVVVHPPIMARVREL